MFSLRNKRDISSFQMKKVPYLLLWIMVLCCFCLHRTETEGQLNQINIVEVEMKVREDKKNLIGQSYSLDDVCNHSLIYFKKFHLYEICPQSILSFLRYISTLSIGTPYLLTMLVLKFEQVYFTNC